MYTHTNTRAYTFIHVRAYMHTCICVYPIYKYSCKHVCIWGLLLLITTVPSIYVTGIYNVNSTRIWHDLMYLCPRFIYCQRYTYIKWSNSQTDEFTSALWLYTHTVDKTHPHELDRESPISCMINFLIFCAHYYVECECIVLTMYIPQMRATLTD